MNNRLDFILLEYLQKIIELDDILKIALLDNPDTQKQLMNSDFYKGIFNAIGSIINNISQTLDDSHSALNTLQRIREAAKDKFT